MIKPYSVERRKSLVEPTVLSSPHLSPEMIVGEEAQQAREYPDAQVKELTLWGFRTRQADGADCHDETE
jgi:hypothetical protein